MKHTNRERIIALAGLYQATALVRQTAEQGHGDPDSARVIIDSILRLDAPSVGDVYGDLEGLRLGLETLAKLRERPNVQATRYAIAVLHLERKLAGRQSVLQQIADGVQRAAEQAEYFGSSTHDTVVGSLADLYVNTVSKLGPRVMVHGEPTYLANPAVANWIRALLLGAVRSAVLWRQCGGTRWQLIFGHRRMLQGAMQLLEEHRPTYH
jgi:high frequency lysogenization protein